MYGSLFGDLPEAKNAAKKDEASSSTDEQSHTHPPAKRQAVEAPSAATSRGHTLPSDGAATSSLSSSSVVRNIGLAGTTMAFVPSAALQRKRNVLKKPSVSGNQANRARSHSESQQSSSWKEEVQIISKKDHDKFIHNPHEEIDSTSAQGSTEQQKESDEIQKLHEACAADPDKLYNPLVPNDLLQYLQKKQAMMERLELEREARESLEKQQSIQQETRNLKTGDKVHALLSAGRGRGRGVSNLPAWLVEKQKKEARLRNLPGDNP